VASLTLTYQPDVGAVRLSVDHTGSNIVSLSRTDANGTAAVRLLAGELPLTGDAILFDYEAALSGVVTYTATDALGTVATSSIIMAANAAWLTVPIHPQFSQSLDLVTGYGAARESRSNVHEVLDRRDPVVTVRPLGSRRGALQLFALDYPTAAALAGVYDRGHVVHLRQPWHQGLDLYHHVPAGGRVAIDAADRDMRRWLVTVDYVEVGRPLGDRRGTAGWTFADTTALGVTFDSVREVFPTFADRTIGALS